MQVGNHQVALAGGGGLAGEHEVRFAGKLAQGEILGWGADENQVAGFGVIPGQEPAPFDVNLTLQAGKNLVEIVNGHYLSHACVVI